MDNLFSLVIQDHKTIQSLEPDHRYGQEIKRRDTFCVVFQKGSPTLGSRTVTSHHIIRNGCFRNLTPDLEKLAMDPRRTPQGIGQTHLPDQIP